MEYKWTTGKVIAAGVFGIFVISIINSAASSAPAASPALTPEQVQQQAADLAAWQQTPAGKLCAKHPGWQREDCDKLIAKKLWIGMSVSMLDYYYGAPDHKNVSNYGRGDQYQYCWNNYTPSCFYDDNGDGIIDSYN